MKKDKKILKIVGNNIRSIRNSIEISQEQLGFLCDLDRTYISDVELSKRNISLINLNSIAEAMNVQLPDILYNQKQNIKKSPNSNGNDYIENKKFKFKSGFIVKPED
ncbi:MAG: helix-turn-helix transcriptional regulator, partial [Deltaproteobacteria bacterium]|nr:helix-turn-helix transcriptional regulator [Deltaproteobacteria bacterium]